MNPRHHDGVNDENEVGLNNYKGIYFNDQKDNKYIDPNNGAHFKYEDMCKMLAYIKQERDHEEQKQHAIDTSINASRNSNVKQSISSFKSNNAISIETKKKQQSTQLNIPLKKSNSKSFALEHAAKLDPSKQVKQIPAKVKVAQLDQKLKDKM